MSFPLMKFGEFLTPNKRPYLLAADEDANLVGMRWYGEGPFHRELKEAHKIRKKSHFVIRQGDVIYNKLFAWKGSFGIVPEELDGMFVSDKFPTYEMDLNLIDPLYLSWFFRIPSLWEQAKDYSTGSAAISKLTLNPPKFLDLEIPLPSLPQQKVIAQKIEHIATRLGVAKKHRADANEMTQVLLQTCSAYLSDQLVVEGELTDVLSGKPRNGWSARCDNSDGGTAVLSLSAVTGFEYRSSAVKRTSLATSEDAHYWLQPGDLLITRSNTPELVGHAAIYNGKPYPCIYPDLTMKLSVDPNRAVTRFVWYWLQTSLVRKYITENAKGTSPTMKKISQGIVMGIPFPTGVSVEEQNQMVAHLDSLRLQVQALVERQEKSTVELSALLPSILDRAFSGRFAVVGSGGKAASNTECKVAPPQLADVSRDMPSHPVVAALIVDNLWEQRSFGRTKLEKLTHLIEHECEVELFRVPSRLAAGPADFGAVLNTEKQASEFQWFQTQEREGKDGQKRYVYLPGPKIQEGVNHARDLLGAQLVKAQNIIDVLRPLQTKTCEVIATLYASWNDFLLRGESPTDQEIIQDVRENWHESKAKIPLASWRRGLDIMRSNDLVPKGTGKPVEKPRKRQSVK